MLGHVVGELDGRFAARWIGYPSSYGPVPFGTGLSYADSVTLGVDALLRAVADTPGPVMLLGYSQGAVVVRRMLGLVADGSLHAPHIVAAGLISDPHRPEGTDPRCDGYGVAGRGPYVPESVEVLWVSNPDDVICNASGDSFVRDLADATESLAVRDLKRWVPSALARYRRGLFQNAAKTAFSRRQWVRDIRRVRTAVDEVRGYLPSLQLGARTVNAGGGRHVAYAAEPYQLRRYEDEALTGCQVLAQWLQVQATFRGRLSSSETTDG